MIPTYCASTEKSFTIRPGTSAKKANLTLNSNNLVFVYQRSSGTRLQMKMTGFRNEGDMTFSLRAPTRVTQDACCLGNISCTIYYVCVNWSHPACYPSPSSWLTKTDFLQRRRSIAVSRSFSKSLTADHVLSNPSGIVHACCLSDVFPLHVSLSKPILSQ